MRIAPRYLALLCFGRLVRFLLRIVRRGGGSALPGLVVNRLAPRFLGNSLSRFETLVVVSGSAGKSTTSKMLVAAVRAHGIKVFTNPSTANIEQGLTSAILENSTLFGSIPAHMAILEIDEAHAAKLSQHISPKVTVLTNVMVDQVDRFYSQQLVVEFLEKIATKTTHTLVVNADDSQLMAMVSERGLTKKSRFFGVTEYLKATKTREQHLTLELSKRLEPLNDLTVVSEIEGKKLRLTRLFSGKGTVREIPEISLPAKGIHYALDAAAAFSATAAIVGEDVFSEALTSEAISGVEAVFGRGERVRIAGQEIDFVLIQNPSSFQLNCDCLDPVPDRLLFAFGSDIRDPSYLWPVTLDLLSHVDIVSGSLASDCALLLSYQGINCDRVLPNIEDAIEEFLALPRPVVGVKTIIFSADPMRRVRNYLGLNRESVSGVS